MISDYFYSRKKLTEFKASFPCRNFDSGGGAGKGLAPSPDYENTVLLQAKVGASEQVLATKWVILTVLEKARVTFE